MEASRLLRKAPCTRPLTFISIPLSFQNVILPFDHSVLNVDFGAREPMPRANEPPDQSVEHRRTVDEGGPVHRHGARKKDNGQLRDYQ